MSANIEANNGPDMTLSCEYSELGTLLNSAGVFELKPSDGKPATEE